MTRATKSAIAAIVVALVVAGVVGAAIVLGRGSSSTPSTQPPAARQQAGGPANNAAFQQFRQCMTDNGVTLSPGQRPDPNDPTVQKARQACAQYAPQGGRFGGGGGFGGPPPAASVTPNQVAPSNDQSGTST
jgi:hypothetical protein